MKSHDANRAALLREREARKADYLEAVAARDAIAPYASRGDALEFDRRELTRAENRVKMALAKMRQWKDPLPDTADAPNTEIATFTTPGSSCSQSLATSVVETAEAVATRIFASDRTPGEGRTKWQQRRDSGEIQRGNTNHSGRPNLL